MIAWLAVAGKLVERNICSWVELEEVVTFRGQKILNGLFGVAKSTLLPDGRPQLRVIMNLIPPNAVMQQLQGLVNELPGVTQYLSVVLEDSEELRMCQSDMTSAFYLFSLPSSWQRFLAFNLQAKGEDIGLRAGVLYCLACKVLPMGWASAVSVMQEVSQALLNHGGLPRGEQVLRTKPLPTWLTEVLKAARVTSRGWYHVYLDNFFSGECLGAGDAGGRARELHSLAEAAWNSAGVLSSEKKKVVEAEAVQELGAMFDSEARLLGASAERLVKLIQSTGKRRSPESGCRLCAKGGCMSYNSGGQVWLLFIRFGDGLGGRNFLRSLLVLHGKNFLCYARGRTFFIRSWVLR